MNDTGIPIIIIMLLMLVSVILTQPKLMLLALLGAVVLYLVTRFTLPIIQIIPADYLVIALISGALGAGGVVLFHRRSSLQK